ncbi:MAG: response regulator transcription factor [Steroidobacteraceae bacterium]|nr:response regulator transcription factor [Steroidobacteraceae bacterium]
MDAPPRTILIADDHPLFRAALRRAVEEAIGAAQVHEAADAGALRAAAARSPEADLVLLDLMMPGSRSFATLAWLRSQHPTMAVIVVSANESTAVARAALEFGAAGYVPKSAPLAELVEAIRTVLGFGQWFPAAALADTTPAQGDPAAIAARLASLTPQQYRVLELLAQGQLNKQIAAELGITEQTTKAHVSATLAKLGARNRTQATLLYRSLEIQGAEPLSLGR